jgi:hypothetical protein
VARAVAAGETNQQVARDLYITVKTVEYHLSQIFTRLGVDAGADIAVCPASTELLTPARRGVTMRQPVVRAAALLALRRKSAATPHGRSMMIEHGGESRAASGGASGSRGVPRKSHTGHASRLKHARYARGPAFDPAAPAPASSSLRADLSHAPRLRRGLSASEDLRPNCQLMVGFVPDRFSACAPRGLIITLRELIITVGRVMIMRRASRIRGQRCAHAARQRHEALRSVRGTSPWRVGLHRRPPCSPDDLCGE